MKFFSLTDDLGIFYQLVRYIKTYTYTGNIAEATRKSLLTNKTAIRMAQILPEATNSHLHPNHNHHHY